MVSLFNIMVAQKQRFAHLSTNIPSLDTVISNGRNRILDFQAVPQCLAPYTVTVSLIISHLKHLESTKVVVVDTLLPFPWHLVVNHPDFNRNWLDTRISHYSADTFAKLYALLLFGLHLSPSTILVINNYHELIELYKMELSASYEETILKHHIERLATIKSNQEQFALVGTKTPLPELPQLSDLLKESPITKFESHVFSLVQLISNKIYNDDLLAILLGHLDTKFEITRPKSQAQLQNSQNSTTFKSRIVLTASTSTPPGSSAGIRSKASLNASLESFITTRLIFYKDWFHKTPYFRERYPPVKDNVRVTINQAELRMVFAVKVEIPSTSHNPIYFDHDNELYHLDDDEDDDNENKYSESHASKYSFLDLSGQEKPTAYPSPISFTQEPEPVLSRSDMVQPTIELQPVEYPPSSPNLRESQLQQILATSELQDIATSPKSQQSVGGKDTNGDDLIVEESEDEIMGSVLAGFNE